MGMKKKMAKIASVAAMMAIANGDEVCDFPHANTPKVTLSKRESKKCKSCRHFKYCQGNPKPMQIACENYERRKH